MIKPKEDRKRQKIDKKVKDGGRKERSWKIKRRYTWRIREKVATYRKVYTK